MTIRHDCAALTGAKEAGRGGPVRKVEGVVKLRNVDMAIPLIQSSCHFAWGTASLRGIGSCAELPTPAPAYFADGGERRL
jgi:hypothetical protein